MNDVINPMESVAQEPLKGGFSNNSIMAANEIFKTNEERNDSMIMGSKFSNQNII
jgi:hypothetical protein